VQACYHSGGMPKVMAEIEETSLSLHLFTGRMIWQTIQNLLEQFPEDAPELEGTVFSRRKHKSTKLTASIMHLVEGELLLFHGDYEATAERTIEYGDLYPPNNPCFCSVMTETFYRAVAVHAMALEPTETDTSGVPRSFKKSFSSGPKPETRTWFILICC